MGRYAGRLRGHLTRGGLEIAETSYRPHQSVASHAHGRPIVVVVLAGAMREFVDGRRVDCAPGTALFHPAGLTHAHHFERPGSRCLVVQMEERWLHRLEIPEGRIPAGPVAGRGEVVTGAARLLHAEFRRGRDALTATLDGLALSLISSLGRQPAAPAERRPLFLRRVLERLHDDPASDASLAALAELAGVSPEHLARTFRREKGLTIGQYVRALRVERARERLSAGKVSSLGRLALELGFYDQSHFTRVFKAHVGCTPGEYLRNERRR